MIRLRGKVSVARLAKDVSAFLADVANEPKWQNGIAHVQLMEGKAGTVGAKWERVQEVSGKKIKTLTELVDATPGKLVAFQADGKVIKYRLDFILKALGASTEVDMRMEGEMLGFASMLEGIAAETLDKEMPANLERLRKALSG